LSTAPYRGVEVAAVQVWKTGQQCGLMRDLKAMIERRSAVKPTTFHMKNNAKLGRSPLKGTPGDAMHALLCSSGHSIGLIANKLKCFRAMVPLIKKYNCAELPN
jgi:IS5 family transposase